MKENNIFDVAIGIINMFLSGAVTKYCCETVGFPNGNMLALAAGAVNVVWILWVLNRMSYTVSTTGTVLEQNSRRELEANYVSVSIVVGYKVNGNTLSHTFSDIESNFQKIYKGTVLRVRYKKENPYKLIIDNSLWYRKIRMMAIFELICLIIMIIASFNP